MAEKLEVQITANADQLVRETRKADRAFTKLADSVASSADEIAKSSATGRDAFGRFVKKTEDGAKAAKKTETAFQRLAKSAKVGATRVRELANRIGDVAIKGLVSGFKGLTSIVSLATKGLVAFGVGLAAIGTSAAVSFAKFQTEFAQVRTLVDESLVDVGALEEGVRRLSREFGVGLIEATQAAYQAISAGQAPATVIEFLEASFRGAAAGAASTGEAVDLFTTVLNAFGAAAGTTANVADVLFATIKAGKTTASELAASLGQVAPVASSAGVSLEETAAAVATLTASGLNTAEATTALKSALVGILKPSKDAEAALNEIGVSAESLRESGFEDAISRVRDAIQSGNGALVDFFPNVRALVGASVLAGEGFDKFGESLKATSNAAGAATEAFEKVASGTGFAFNKLRQIVTDTFRQIGKAIDPFVKRGVDAFVEFATNARREVEILGDALAREFGPDVADAFGILEGAATQSSDLASKALGLIADGFDVVASGVRDAAPIIAGVVATFETLADVVRLAANVVRTTLAVALVNLAVPIGAVIKGAAALAGVFSNDVARSLKESSEEFDEFTKELQNQGVQALKDTGDAFVDLFTVTDGFEKVEKTVSRFGNGIKGAAASVRGLNDEVTKQRALGGYGDALTEADDAADGLAKSADRAAAAQAGLGAGAAGAATQVSALGAAASGTSTSVEGLIASFEKAGSGAVGFTEQLKILAAGVASIGTVQTGEQALAARQDAIAQLIGAADARLESAIGAARTRAQALNAEAQANLAAAKAAQLEAIRSRDEGAIRNTGREREKAEAALEETIRQTNQAFNDQRTIATEAFDAVRAEIQKVDGALSVFRDDAIAKASEAGKATIAEANKAFKAEEDRLRVARAKNEIASAEFLAGVAENERKLAEAIGDVSDEFNRVRDAAREAFDLATATQNVETLANALTGEFAVAVQMARDEAERFGATQEELNATLQDVIDKSNEAAVAVEESGDAADKSAEGYDALNDSVKEAGEELARTATEAEKAAAKILKAAIAIAQAQAQAASFARTGVGVRPGGETQSGVNARFGAGQSSGFGFGLGRNSRSVGQVNVGEGVFHDGGPVNATGRPKVEAGEFVLSQRGLSDMGRAFAALFNGGRGDTVVNQTNNFNASATPGGSGEDLIDELAFKLRPALLHTGRLAAAASPVT